MVKDQRPAAFYTDTHATQAVATSSVEKARGNTMTDDDLQDLMNARAALVKRRLTWAQTIAAPGETPESAIKAIIEVQQAIEVIDVAIEELEEELEERLEAEDEDDE